MKYRRFGATDLVVSELGLGSSALGGGLFYRNEKEARRVLDAAYDAGITFYDTSERYGFGRHEEIIGQAFHANRDKVVIATKGGILPKAFGRLTMPLRPLLTPVRGMLRRRRRALGLLRDRQKIYSRSDEDLRRSLEGSLRRLDCDYVDLFQFSAVTTSAFEQDDVYDTLDRLKDEGKIRYGGATILRVNLAFNSLPQMRLDSIQLAVSMLDPVAAQRFVPLARDRSLAVIGRSALGQGFLTGAAGHVKAMESFIYTEAELIRRRSVADSLRFLVNDQRTLSQAALQYMLQLDGVSTTLFAAENCVQLAENLGALEAPSLSSEELAEVDILTRNIPEQ
jgi:aryl-alcohol dehydrogenase-like predicted oxidoreductase